MPKHNIVSYNILLNLYGLYRQSDKALQCYNQMRQQGHQPDEKTFVLLLHALSQSSKTIDQSQRIFAGLEENKRGPMLTAAMIAALTRAQRFEEVKELLKKLPKENILFYAIQANIDPTHAASFQYPITITNEQLAMYDLLMSHMYIYAGVQDRLSTIDEMLYDNVRLKSILSYSYFERSNGTIAYFKGTSTDLQPCEHTEKLALAEALKEHEHSLLPILIGKNHRVCHECHDYFKQSSLKKKIYLRDSTRFHLFSNGSCS